MKNNLNKKTGFSIIEIVVVIAIIGVLMALFGGKMFSFLEKTDLQSTINQDGDTLSKSALNYKSNSPISEGTFKGITTHQLGKYVTDKMDLVESDGTTASNGADDGGELLQSLGLNGGCTYEVSPDNKQTSAGADVDNSGNYAIQIFMDCSNATTQYNWSDRTQAQAEDVFFGALKKRSLSPVKAVSNATAKSTVGTTLDSNGRVPVTEIVTGGNEFDGKMLIRGIVF